MSEVWQCDFRSLSIKSRNFTYSTQREFGNHCDSDKGHKKGHNNLLNKKIGYA
jgi:hypothetical protein